MYDVMDIQAEQNCDQIDMKIHREKHKLKTKLNTIQMKQVNESYLHQG